VHVQRVRAKVGAEHARLIRTIRNVGYLLDAPRSSTAAAA
jgi:DNA-binding response OmpR family regulator